MKEIPGLSVGVDWGNSFHQVCVVEADGNVRGERPFEHSVDGLEALVEWLSTYGAVRVAIETPHGPVVETLLERGFEVYAINPKQLDRFRDRFSPSGAKDDRRDAYVLADSLRTDQHCFRRVEPTHPLVVELREWSRMHGGLKDEQVRLTNQLRQQLQRYYPQVLELTKNLSYDWFLAVLERAPTPDRARRLRPSTVARVLSRHRVRKWSADELLKVLRGPGFTVADGTVAAAQAHVQLILGRLRLVNSQLRECVDRIRDLTTSFANTIDGGDGREQNDVDILRTFPGVGKNVLAALLSEAWALLRARDYHALRTQSGVAPVTKRSGKRLIVLRRYACDNRLRNAMHHWAFGAMVHDPCWKARYAALRARGHSHGRALRQLGDRLLSIVCAMLRSGTLYDPQRLEGPQPAPRPPFQPPAEGKRQEQCPQRQGPAKVRSGSRSRQPSALTSTKSRGLTDPPTILDNL